MLFRSVRDFLFEEFRGALLLLPLLEVVLPAVEVFHLELAEVGPNSKSKISARADAEYRNITCVFEVTPAAVEAWEKA